MIDGKDLHRFSELRRRGGVYTVSLQARLTKLASRSGQLIDQQELFLSHCCSTDDFSNTIHCAASGHKMLPPEEREVVLPLRSTSVRGVRHGHSRNAAEAETKLLFSGQATDPVPCIQSEDSAHAAWSGFVRAQGGVITNGGSDSALALSLRPFLSFLAQALTAVTSLFRQSSTSLVSHPQSHLQSLFASPQNQLESEIVHGMQN